MPLITMAKVAIPYNLSGLSAPRRDLRPEGLVVAMSTEFSTYWRFPGIRGTAFFFALLPVEMPRRRA
jgi:hypothetical protein